MKANHANLLELLKAGRQFVVPICPRLYSWEQADCERLWTDILTAGAGSPSSEHFTGSIAYAESEQSSRTDLVPVLVIDGQQRVTMLLLLLTALAAHLDGLPEDEREPVDGFSPEQIRESCFVNHHRKDNAHYKFLLPQSDRKALKGAQSALRDENVERKHRAALTWCEQINELPEEQRDGRLWHYVLLAKAIVRDWKKNNVRASELLDYARLRRSSTVVREWLI